ncbi:MAG: hypothetical protein M3165_03345, partial [Actinomycetota bacterium]|nr:hypothetical protein [Actinomycetota bacterium]
MSGTGTPARRVVVHVGLHKTGTTYLQSLMRHNRRRLARRAGVYVPPGGRKTVFASLDLIPWDSPLGRDVRVAGAWDRLADEVNGCGLPTAVVSEERLDVANQRQARRAVSSFADADVHVLVTVRDLARVAVSHWQEDVKNGATWTLEEFMGRLQDPTAAATQPARGFWLHEDVTAVLRTWSAAVPEDHVHVVTVPQAGSPPELLTARFGSVVGFTPDDVPVPPPWDNENVGDAGTELLRRLNEHLDGAIDRSTYKRAVSVPVVRRLASLPDRGLPALTDTQRAWAEDMSGRFAEEIRARGYRVVGDLADLRPSAGVVGDSASAGRNRADDGALLQAALEALSEVARRHGEQVARADTEAAASRANLAGRLPRARTHL